jgi:hypothetical protein
MRFPRITPTTVLLGLLAVLMFSSMISNYESLTFCEKALYNELSTLQKETNLKGPVKFTEVCPEVRQRQETNLAKWLEVILALMVQFAPHPPGNP